MEPAKDPATLTSLLPRLLAGLERVAVPFQAAKFVLAVQRKFARK